MKKRWVTAFVLASAFGSAMHFFYTWLPLPVVGLFAPVSESVWEHMKIMFWPFVISALVLTRWEPDKKRAWSAFLAAALLQPILMAGAFYILQAGLGIESLFADIALYLAVMAAGCALAREFIESGETERSLGLLIVLTAIYAVSLIVFSMAAPNLPIFIAN